MYRMHIGGVRAAGKIEDLMWRFERYIEEDINRKYILYLLCFLIILFLLINLQISHMNIFLLAGLIMSYYTIYSDMDIWVKIGLIVCIIIITIGPVLNQTYNYYNNSRKKKKNLN